MNKLLTTAVVFATLTTSAMADPVTDFFGGIFGDQSPPQARMRKNKHARHTVPQNANDGGNDDWTASWGHSNHGGSHMVASFYGHGEHLSRRTASGALFNPHGYTAAHRSLPFGTHLRVCHHGCVTVVVNDRGPFVRGRSLDLSYGAARAIGMGSTKSITVERLN